MNFVCFKKHCSSLDPLPSLKKILAGDVRRRSFPTIRLTRVLLPKTEVKEEAEQLKQEVKEELKEEPDWYANQREVYDGPLFAEPVP